MKPLRTARQARRPFAVSGAIAQLGERLHGMQEVSGSIPLGSTNLLSPGKVWNGKKLLGVVNAYVEANMHEQPKAPEHLSKEELEQELDIALRQTFPASDPIAVGDPTAIEPERPIDRKPALLDKELVRELAKNVSAKLKT